MDFETTNHFCGQSGVIFKDCEGGVWIILKDVYPPHITSDCAVKLNGDDAGNVLHLSRIPQPECVPID